MSDDDAKTLHSEGETCEAFHQLGREESDRLGLVRAPSGGGVVLIPLVELPRGTCRQVLRAKSQDAGYLCVERVS